MSDTHILEGHTVIPCDDRHQDEPCESPICIAYRALLAAMEAVRAQR